MLREHSTATIRPMKPQATPLFRIALLCAILLPVLLPAALAGPRGAAGPYRVELSTEPAVVPVGKAQLLVRLTDASGKPVEGAQVRALVQMPSMGMGEKQAPALPKSGQPGVYAAPAAFGMQGDYQATIVVQGSLGAATAALPIKTGENTAVSAGPSLAPITLLPWLFGIALALFVIYRLWRIGHRPDWRSFANRGVLSGLLLLGVMLGASLYAVAHWRRPGSMTPMEAQSMQMKTPAPPGESPVVLAGVKRGSVESAVRYTGQAVGFNEVDVQPRVQGWITWMPSYVGRRVHAGEVLARLDTSQVKPQIAERQAAVTMSRQGVDVTRREYQQAQAGVAQSRAEVQSKRDAVAGARADVTAASEEKASAEADLSAAQTQAASAEAGLSAMQADQQYWQQEIARERELLAKGAVSKDEFQREQAQAAGADGKVQQAQAAIRQVGAQIRAAQARVRKSDAMIDSATRKAQQMASDVRTSEAAVRSAQAAADASRQRIAQSQSGVAQAQASLSASTTTRNYSEVRAPIDGIISQRLISPGQLVNPGQALLRVAQVSPIRLQANVAESDLGRIRPGATVTVQDPRTEGRPVTARVTSVTPVADPVARTGIVEAIYSNKEGRFMPGGYLTMDISTGHAERALHVPAAAILMRPEASDGVLSEGVRYYVWAAEAVADSENRYTVQPVDVVTGITDGAETVIVSGLKEGQQVVVEGAAYLKSGDTVSAATAPVVAASPAPAAIHKGHEMPGMDHAASDANTATVTVSSQGFKPASVSLRANVPAKLTFLRTDDKNCATEVVLPEYGLRRAMPLNRPVTLEFTPRKGNITFTCGMNMLSGKVVAQ